MVTENDIEAGWRCFAAVVDNLVTVVMGMAAWMVGRVSGWAALALAYARRAGHHCRRPLFCYRATSIKRAWLALRTRETRRFGA